MNPKPVFSPARILTLIILPPLVGLIVTAFLYVVHVAKYGALNDYGHDLKPRADATYLTPYSTPIIDQPNLESCDWRTELDRTSRILDPQGNIRWEVVDLNQKYIWGMVYIDTGQVQLDSEIPCVYVSSVVIHEWAHWMQRQAYKTHDRASKALENFGGLEVNADCVAHMLGAVHHPYIGHRECSDNEIYAAKMTMQGKPVK